MWCTGRVADFTACAETRIREASGRETFDGRVVDGEAFALPNDIGGEIEADGPKVAQLRKLVLRTAVGPIEILDPNDEVTARGPRRDPGNEGRPQVADVQTPGRGRRESTTGHDHILPPMRPKCDDRSNLLRSSRGQP